MRRPALRVASAALLVALLFIPGALARDRERLAPLPLEARAGMESIEARLGSYCVSTGPRRGEQAVGLCRDAVVSKPPTPRLDVRPRQVVRLVFSDNLAIRDRVVAISARLVTFASPPDEAQRGPALEVRRVRGPRWNVRMPQNGLGPAQALALFVRYPGGGDSEQFVGIRYPADEPHEKFLCPANSLKPFDSRELIGATLEQAGERAARNGCQVRTASIDGEPQPGTGDYIPSRVNVAVESGIVTEVLSIG